MNRTFTLMAATAAVVVATQAFAVGSTSQASTRRLLMNCMTRQMAASKTISYNEAAKVCKDQLKHPSEGLAANNTTKVGSSR